MDLWKFISLHLSNSQKVALLYVIDSIGSSPGRRGFKMAVSTDGSITGSIGGGIMEHKLVELSRSLLESEKPFEPFIKHQIHRKDSQKKSGMICSGEQTIAFYCLDNSQDHWIIQLLISLKKNKKGILTLNNSNIEFRTGDISNRTPTSIDTSENKWYYEEAFGLMDKIYLVGGGHVGLALSAIMKSIGFYVVVLDDRDSLNTMQENIHADETKVIDYSDVARYISMTENTYVVLVSFGYRTDKEVLKQLIGKDYKYLGMMGSRKKVETLFEELESEGYTKTQLSQVHAPIGILINSKTPEEIAISIAAQIIQVKNS